MKGYIRFFTLVGALALIWFFTLFILWSYWQLVLFSKLLGALVLVVVIALWFLLTKGSK